MDRKRETLRRFFGCADFRRGQEKIVDTLCAGRDALCVMPTGADKPKTAQELLRISGIGDKKAEKYGKVFLDEIKIYLAEK